MSRASIEPVRLWAPPDGYELGDLYALNALLERAHYLGPIAAARVVVVQWRAGSAVAGMAWRWPTSRRLPADGTWLELARWVLTPEAGFNAGSRMHGAVTRILRARFPELTTLVSYSDPGAGHTGALYRSCNWRAAPTWHALRPPPSGNGDRGAGAEGVKARWVFPVRRDSRRGELLRVNDGALNPSDAEWSGE